MDRLFRNGLGIFAGVKLITLQKHAVSLFEIIGRWAVRMQHMFNLNHPTPSAMIFSFEVAN